MKTGLRLWKILKTLEKSFMRDHTENTISITATSDYITGLDIDHHYGNTIDISSITTTTFDTSEFDDLFSSTDITLTINEPVEFEDHMPDVAKVEDMCNDYPALAKAYENFKTMYAMVHQDWKGRQEDDPLPF